MNGKKYISTLKTNMASLDFRLKIDETKNYLLEEIKHNGLMSKKHKNVEGFESLF